MDSRLEQVIKKQEGLIAALEKQHAADQRLITSQKKLLQAQQEKAALLEKEKQALLDAGNEMAAANEKLEKICTEQQELLTSFSRIFSEK
ncbi:hypothetical protein NXH76_19835 [Blautia schinkii]|nr:hypothetical protein [Blautia schinkii]